MKFEQPVRLRHESRRKQSGNDVKRSLSSELSCISLMYCFAVIKYLFNSSHFFKRIPQEKSNNMLYTKTLHISDDSV